MLSPAFKVPNSACPEVCGNLYTFLGTGRPLISTMSNWKLGSTFSPSRIFALGPRASSEVFVQHNFTQMSEPRVAAVFSALRASVQGGLAECFCAIADPAIIAGKVNP